MLRTSQLPIVVCVLAFTGANASAQVPVGSTGRVGDSAQITRENQRSDAGYNHVVGKGVPTAVVKDVPGKKTPSRAARAKPARAGDIQPGNALRDKNGVAIGTVELVDADGVVVNTGQAKIMVPLIAFGKDDQGLVLGITAAKFAELVTKAHASN